MNYLKTNMSSYNLHTIKTDRFKTIHISINFRRPVKKEEITIRKLLFALLCYSNKKYNTNRLMEIKREDLYMLGLSTNTTVLGNYINSYIDIRFLNKEYSNESILEDSLEFLFDILFNPNIKDGLFNEESFNNVVKSMKTSIASMKDNLSFYALIRLLEETDSNNPASYRVWGYLEDLEAIKLEDVYEYYQEVLRSDIIDIFVVGDIDTYFIKQKFEDNFKINTIKRKKEDVYFNYKKGSIRTKKLYIQERNINQSKLSMSLKVLNITERERRYVLPLYTDILGGGSFSKLFQNVREENSLCYSIFSTAKAPSSLILINSGIDENNYNKALKLIKREIKNMSKNVTKEEVERSINNFVTSINSSLNTQSGIINYYFAKEVLKSDTIEDKIKKIKHVTKQDVMTFSTKVKLDTILLLGGKNEEN